MTEKFANDWTRRVESLEKENRHLLQTQGDLCRRMGAAECLLAALVAWADESGDHNRLMDVVRQARLTLAERSAK